MTPRSLKWLFLFLFLTPSQQGIQVEKPEKDDSSERGQSFMAIQGQGVESIHVRLAAKSKLSKDADSDESRKVYDDFLAAGSRTQAQAGALGLVPFAAKAQRHHINEKLLRHCYQSKSSPDYC